MSSYARRIILLENIQSVNALQRCMLISQRDKTQFVCVSFVKAARVYRSNTANTSTQGQQQNCTQHSYCYSHNLTFTLLLQVFYAKTTKISLYIKIIKYTHTVSQKRDLYTFAHNFGKCWRIFEIFPLLNSLTNFLTNSTMEKFRKSVNICQRYVQKYIEASLGQPMAISGVDVITKSCTRVVLVTTAK